MPWIRASGEAFSERGAEFTLDIKQVERLFVVYHSKETTLESGLGSLHWPLGPNFENCANEQGRILNTGSIPTFVHNPGPDLHNASQHSFLRQTSPYSDTGS